MPAKANLSLGVLQTSIRVNTSSSPVKVGLVGYLSGDVDGSYAGVTGALDLDTIDPTHFTALSSIFGMPVGQFGVV